MLLVPPIVHVQGQSSRGANVKPSSDPVLGGSDVPSRKAEQFYHGCNHLPQMLSGIFTHFS